MRSWFVVVALGSATAHAQAPGQLAPQPMAAPSPGVMAKRWAISAGLASETLAADADGKPDATFGLLELAGRFRIRAPFEVGLVFSAGGGMKGQLATAGLYAGVRYRFLADRPWNIYAALDLGVASVANGDAPKDDRRGRGSLRLGAGVERRFTSLAIHAELRLVGVGENDRAVVPEVLTPGYQMTRSKLSGGALGLGATYYF